MDQSSPGRDARAPCLPPRRRGTRTPPIVIPLGQGVRIAHHGPSGSKSDSQLACHRYASFPQTFLNQFATVETLQLWIAAYRMSTGLTPEKTQQRTALLGHPTEPLGSSTGVFPWDDPHVTGQRLAIHEPSRVAQEDLGRQCGDGPHSRMRHEQSCSTTLLGLL